MTSRIVFNIEKMLDRGPEYGFLEAQVDFEEEAWPAKGMSFASVIVPLAKTEAGSMTFDEIRASALSKTLSFMVNCKKLRCQLIDRLQKTRNIQYWKLYCEYLGRMGEARRALLAEGTT